MWRSIRHTNLGELWRLLSLSGGEEFNDSRSSKSDKTAPSAPVFHCPGADIIAGVGARCRSDGLLADKSTRARVWHLSD